MGWVINFIYLMVLLVVSPFLAWKSWRTGKYRDGWRQKFLGDVPVSTHDRVVIWIHAVSVGEVLLIKPLIKLWREQHPVHQLVLTVTTSTGYKVARETYPEVVVTIAPLDFTWSVSRALERIKPNLICLVELELWPNLIRVASQQHIPIGIINGRLSEKSYRGYSRIQLLMRPLFQRLSFVLAQDETIARRFQNLGTPENKLLVTGSMKYDGISVSQNQEKISALRTLLQLDSSEIVLVAGSTHAPEEGILLAIYQRLKAEYPNLRLLIVPRHAERFQEVAELIRSHGLPHVKKSMLTTSLKQSLTLNQPVVLIDTLGELSIAWGLAHLAYVGGSMGNQRGGQNMLEPAAYGAAVITGPNTWNFAEIMKQLLMVGGIYQVQHELELESTLRLFLDSPSKAVVQGSSAQEMIQSHQGATAHTYEHLTTLLAANPAVRLGKIA